MRKRTNLLMLSATLVLGFVATTVIGCDPSEVSTYNVTIGTTNGATIQFLTSNTGVKENETVRFTITPPEKKVVGEVMLTNLVEVTLSDGVYSFVMPSHDVKIDVSLKEKEAADYINEMKGEMTVTGTFSSVLVSEDGSETPLDYPLKTMFGETSYHIEVGENGSEIDSTLYTNSEGQVLHYYITPDNQLDYEVIYVDDEQTTLASWDDYDNPFEVIDPSIASIDPNDPNTIILDKTSLDTVLFISNITYNYYISPSDGTSLLEEVKLTIENDKISKISFKTVLLQDIFSGKLYYKGDFTLDTSKDTEHEYPLPEPYETMSYHEPLIEAIEYLNTGTFYTTITMDLYDFGSYIQYTYSSPELFYGFDVDYQESYSIINKDGIAYEVLSDLDGNLYYLSDNPLGNYKDFMVDNLVAVQLMKYNEETKEYTAPESVAGYMAYGLNPMWPFDPTLQAATSLTITLDGNKISKLTADCGYCLYTIEYSYDKATIEPPSIDSIQEKTTLGMFLGIYKYLIDEVEVTIEVTEEGVTFNGEACEVIGLNRYGELEFIYNEINYSIADDGTLYNNATYESYNPIVE